MTTCEEFEVAVEMKLHGALEAAPAAALEQHLTSCASCRSFQQLATHTEQTMNLQATMDSNGFDWEAMKNRVKSAVETNHRRTLQRVGVLALLLLPLMVGINYGAPLRSFFSLAMSLIFIAVVVVASSSWRYRLIREQEGNRGEYLFRYRRDLEQRISRARRALGVSLLPWGLLAWRGEGIDTVHGLSIVGLGVVTLGAALYIWTVERPRWQRQLDTLKP